MWWPCQIERDPDHRTAMDRWFLVNNQYRRAGKVPRADQIELARVRPVPASCGSKADAKESGSARLNGRFPFGCRWRPLACSYWPRLIFARDLHCPICAMRGCAFCAGDADARRLVKQEIFSMSHRGNPLIERSFEAVIAVRNIFGSPPRSRCCDPRTEGSEHIVVERVFCGHRLGLFQRNAIESSIHGDTSFAVLQTKIGNQPGR